MHLEKEVGLGLGLYNMAWCCVSFVHWSKCPSKIVLQCFVLGLQMFSKTILRIFSCKIKSKYAPVFILLFYSYATKDLAPSLRNGSLF